MPAFLTLLIFLLSLPILLNAKEVALTFDDAPTETSLHFTASQRTDELIEKLNRLKVPQVMIFSNACKGQAPDFIQTELRKYVNAGHLVANHTCSHFRLDAVGFQKFSEDIARGETELGSLMKEPKFFRYPYLNEGTDPSVRDQVRIWLKAHNYRNASISGDNEDPTFSTKINEAKKQGLSIDYESVKKAYLDHVISSLECADRLAIKNLGRSPRHVLLLHEVDATVMFLDSLVAELRKRGWKIISAKEAFSDPMYLEEPKNTYSGYGIIAQLAFEKTGKKEVCYDYPKLVKKLNAILGLKK